MPLRIVRGNLVEQRTDAIVNAANEWLREGGGVCGAVFHTADREALQAACDEIGRCDTGDAVLTPGFRLPARFVIHTVGPVWRSGANGEEGLLASCYRRSLEVAQAHGLQSVAFPLISAGTFGYPRDQALRVAVETVGAYLLAHDELDVTLVLLGDGAVPLPAELRQALDRYIGGHYDAQWLEAAERHRGGFAREPGRQVAGAAPPPAEQPPSARPSAAQPSAVQPPPTSAPTDRLAHGGAGDASAPYDGLMKRIGRENAAVTGEPAIAPSPGKQPATGRATFAPSLDDAVAHPGDSFARTVLRLIDEGGRSDVEVYKRANLDRKLFSKLRTDPAYRPSRPTAVALCVALELRLDETQALLARAGYALSESSKADLIVAYFIEHERYDIFELNEALFAFDQPCLGV